MMRELAKESSKIPSVRLLIGRNFVDSSASRWVDVLNPATQTVLARVPFASRQEVDAAVAAAAEAFPSWRKMPIGARARVFLKYQQLSRDHMQELAALLTAEQGKTLLDAEGDVFRGLEVVEQAANIGTLQLGELAQNVASNVNTHTVLQPIGVCVGITPFNFPAMIPLWMYPIAIACGNTFVLKPSEKVPLTAIKIAKLLEKAGLPKGVLNIVHGGREVVDALLTHPKVKAISFVGSTPIARYIYETGTKHGK